MPRIPRYRRLGRLLIVSALTAAGIALGTAAASAHVTVNPGTAVAGSYPELSFRVPNESAKAGTVGLTVHFPLDHPFASVAVKKQPGWTATVTKSKLAKPISDDDNATITEAVSTITWKADAGVKISLGEFAEFDVSVGPVPDVPELAFKVDQNYDDGSVVKWDQPTPASGAEPEHPAPTLVISPAAGSSTTASSAGTASTAGIATAADPGTPTSSAATVTVAPDVSTAAQSARADNAARVLSVIAIVIAALALLVGALGLRRRGTRS